MEPNYGNESFGWILEGGIGNLGEENTGQGFVSWCFSRELWITRESLAPGQSLATGKWEMVAKAERVRMSKFAYAQRRNMSFVPLIIFYFEDTNFMFISVIL